MKLYNVLTSELKRQRGSFITFGQSKASCFSIYGLDGFISQPSASFSLLFIGHIILIKVILMVPPILCFNYFS